MYLRHLRLEIAGFHLENIEMALVCDVYCEFVLSHLVSWDRCGT